MFRTILIAVLLVLLSLAAFAADPVVSPADAFITVVCAKALPGDVALNVELATAKGAVTRAFAAGIALKADALKLDGEKLTGTAEFTLPLGDPAKDTAVSITVDAVLAENKVTGTFTGSVVDSKVKGDLSGSIRSLFASFGGRDFYPSPEHPVGFRGDGNGYFPGATPVTEWQEGTLAVQKAPAGSRAKDVTYVADEKGGKNIVWKTEMPAWVNSEPIVVGDRIFTCGEPNLLICADANTGKVLWSHRMSVFQAMGLNAETTERCQTLADIYQVTFDAAKYHMLSLIHI